MIIPIVFSTDHNFVMPACVTIHSLLSTAKEGNTYAINVIVDPDVTSDDRDKLKRQVEFHSPRATLEFVEIGEVFKHGYEIRDISKACYNRLMIPWLLPQYDKVIYSDVDIIFTGDISEIYSKNMGRNLVAGVSGDVWKKGVIKKYLSKIGADSEEYINSGFLVINSRLQRELNLKERYIDYSKRKYIYQDQDIINLVCKGKISHLPGEFNLKPVNYYGYPKDKAKVIHYIGLKPWDNFTYCWNEWWTNFYGSVVADAEFNKMISTRILTWNHVMKNMKKALIERMKFFRNLLRSYK